MTIWRGHDRQIAELIAAPDAGRMHHGWIFAGPQGVGKAGIATDFAKRLLVDGAERAVSANRLAPDDNDSTVKLMEAGAHPDFVRLERLEKDGKGADNGSLARNITVDQVRGLARLLHSAPSMGTRLLLHGQMIDIRRRPVIRTIWREIKTRTRGRAGSQAAA